MEALEAQAGEKQAAARWFSDSSIKFRAKMQLAGDAMNFQMPPSRRTDLDADVKRLTGQLCKELPEMARAIAEAKGRQAKDDVLNLAGDYVEALCNSYMVFITNHIAINDVQPQAEKAVQTARDEFLLIITSDDMPALAREQLSHKDMELLKAIQVNLGNFHDPIAGFVSGVLGFIVKVVLFNYLGRFGYTLGSYLQNFLEKAATLVIPTKMFVDHVITDLLKQLDEVPDMMFRTMDESILPQLGVQVKADFQDKVDRTCALLEERGGALRQEAETLLSERAALAGQDQALARMA